jgi:hypothetical protein
MRHLRVLWIVGFAAFWSGAFLSAPVLSAPRWGVDLWPFYVADRESVAGVRSSRALGPLFESWSFDEDAAAWHRISEGARFTVRPFFARGERDGFPRTEFMYPLGRVQGARYGSRGRVTPIANWGAKGAEDAHRYWTIGPVFGGRTEAGEGYGGLFPILGRGRERFGKEALSFAMFPLYGRSRDHSGFERQTFGWPIYARGEGGGRELFRVWPAYGYDRRAGEYERNFALWPFFFWRKDRLGQETERHARFALPFWGRSESASTRSSFVGGPLYVRTDNLETGAYSLDMPWPFIRRAESPGVEGSEGTSLWRLWPFAQWSRGPGWRETSLALGLVSWRNGKMAGQQTRSRRFLFVSRFEDLVDPETGMRRRTRDLWPLFRMTERTDSEGNVFGRVVAPWPIPLRGEGFHRHLLGIFTLYERTYTQDEERTDIAWGFARTRRKPGYRFNALGWWTRETAVAAAPQIAPPVAATPQVAPPVAAAPPARRSGPRSARAEFLERERARRASTIRSGR